MWENDLRPILIERYPGSPGNHAVRQVRKQYCKPLSTPVKPVRDHKGTSSPHTDEPDRCVGADHAEPTKHGLHFS